MSLFKHITTGEYKEFDNFEGVDDQGFVPVASTQNNTMTVDDFDYQPVTQFQGTPETPIEDISRIEAPQLEMTPTETRAQSYVDEIAGINQRLLGESADRGRLEDEEGLPDQLRTRTELANQIKQLQNEALAVPMQIQQESEGRGRTKAGTSVLEMGRLRENAIKALTTSALLEAANNNILTSQNLVDRALAQKYDPIRAQIAVLKENLELIINSPQYTLEDKNRALKQMAIQEKKEKEAAKREEEERTIWTLATQAAQLGLDPMTLNRVQTAKTKEEALRIMAEAGAFAQPEEPMKTQIIDTPDGEKILINSQTGEVIKSFGRAEAADASKWGVVGTDRNGNSIYGFINTSQQSVTPYQMGGSGQNFSSIPADGSFGGQCGDYVHSIMNGTPKFGDTWQSKQAAMNVSIDDFKKTPQVGDIVTFKTNLPYGHVAVVTSVGDGNFTVTESNYNLDEKVTNGRVISLNDPNILGAYRGAGLKGSNLVQSGEVQRGDKEYYALEAAGLLGAPREEQVKHLYGQSDRDRYLDDRKIVAGLENVTRAANTVVRDADTALNMMKDLSWYLKSDGVASATTRVAQAKIPGTKMYEVDQLIESVKSNVGIDTLMNIKNSGAGLGQVPQQQLITLQSVLGLLNIGRSPELLKRDLEHVKMLYESVQEEAKRDLVRMGVAKDDPGTSSGNIFISSSGNTYNLPY